MSVIELVQAPSPNHIRTYTGAWINPLEPTPETILIEDIAHALANQCRFTGHVQKYYSVAQHSCHVSGWLFQDQPLNHNTHFEGLMHDASEAYLSDIARPVKRSTTISAFYDEAEDRLMRAIADKFDFQWPTSDAVKYADDVMLRTEQRDLMLGATYPGEMRKEVIDCWPPEKAEEIFLNYYYASMFNLGRV